MHCFIQADGIEVAARGHCEEELLEHQNGTSG